MPHTRKIDLIVHATHEAGLKVGGIGAVLDGLMGSEQYNHHVARTVVVGPFNANDPLEMERLLAPRNRLTIRYSSRAGVSTVAPELERALERVELFYHVEILYGTRFFGGVEHEVLLVDAGNIVPRLVNDFKVYLWQRYGLESSRYEWFYEFNVFMNAALPSYAALQAIVGDGDYVRPPAIRAPGGQSRFLIAHEWLGVPLLFAAEYHQGGAYNSVFYAHEVATVRPIVEEHSGHDTRFYNVMRVSRAYYLALNQVFGDQSAFFKDAIIRAAGGSTGIFAVGDPVLEELRFLSPEFAHRDIDLVYNGVPNWHITLEEKRASKSRLQQYCQNLLGYYPDWVFTHVTRLIPSKALWRDIRVMEHLDHALAERGERAILFTLSSVIPAGRRAEDVMRWEQEYGWPVGHRWDNGDLIATEIPYFQMIEQFNQQARATRVVLINQFGFSPDRLGRRLPEGTEFMDIRKGSDLEFGQSIYEPFGIAQVEPLSFGALCMVSSSCGCVGFINRAGGLHLPNVIVSDYISLPPALSYRDLAGLLSLGRAERDVVEAQAAGVAARKVLDRLPRSDEAAQRLLDDGYALGQRMSWEVVVSDYLIPALSRIGNLG